LSSPGGVRAGISIPIGLAIAFLGLAALLLAPGVAKAANPSILNTAEGCSGQTTWLVSCATTGIDGNNSSARRTRVSALMSHDADKSINALITDQWGSNNNVHSLTATRPSISGGYPRSRADLTLTHTTSNSGITCNTFTFSGTRRTSNRVLGLRARDSASQSSGTTNSNIKFVGADNCLGPEDFAYIYSWGANNFGNEITPGSNLTFTYVGDDADTTGDSDFQGINWRLRNLRTGDKTAATLSCPGGGDNSTKSLTVNFPTRGAWVVEAELRDGDGCGQNQNSGYWFPIGTADVNSSAAPTFDLTASRPQLNGNTTITAGNFSDPDSAAGGGAQVIEWDLDENTGNGVGGFEGTPHVAGVDSRFTSNQTRTINTTGMSPGLHTVRARVTDNGAMDAADDIRRTRTLSTTFLVNTPPVANPQSVATETAVPKPITLSGSDLNGDPLTWSIVTPPSNGILSGTGANRTYTSNATFAGTDSFVVQANDGFGGTHNATITVRVDPQTQITAQPPSQSGSSTANFSFTSPVPGATFECRIDSDEEAAFTACTSPRQFLGLPEGEHTFDVRAIAAGNTDPTPASYTWTVDLTSPNTELLTAPPANTPSSDAEFTFESEDPTDVFECRIDSTQEVDFVPCDSAGQQNYTGLGEGPHTFQVRARDTFNRPDPSPASHTWTIDQTAPVATLDSAPPDPSNSDEGAFEFSSSEPGTLFECRIDSTDENDFAPCTSPQSYPGLDDGPHTFDLRPSDAAGNVGDVVSHAWSIDTAAPDTSLDVTPPPATASAQASFEFSSSDASAGFECRLDSSDDAAWEECSSPQLYADLGDGDHTFEVRAVDPAGNRDPAPPSHAWSVDTTAPVTTIDSGPSGATQLTAASFEFSAEAGAEFECRLDAAAWEPCTSPQAYSDLADGGHVFRVRAADALDNVDPSPAVRSWTVDTAAPTASITAGPPALTNATSAQLEFTAGEPGATFECRLNSSVEEDFEDCTSPETLAGLGQGAQAFDVRATDAVGNTGPVDTRTWTVDTAAPAVSIDGGPAPQSTSTGATFLFSAESGAAFQCRLDLGSWQACASPRAYAGLDDGSHSFQVRATDAAGNTGTAAERNWTIADSGPPQTSITKAPAPSTTATDADFEYGSSEPASTFACSLDGAAFAACGGPGTTGAVSFTGLSVGDHTFAVRATDADGLTDGSPATHDWTVTEAPATPPPAAGGTLGAVAQSPVITPAKGALKRGRGTGATISCPTGPCNVTQKKAKVKIGGVSYRAVAKVATSLAAGSTTQVKVVLSKAGRAALAATGSGRLTLKLTVSSAGGAVTKKIKLKVKP
jgi:hypothetical protein